MTEFVKLIGLDRRHISVGPTTPQQIGLIQDHEFRCPRCASVDLVRSEVWHGGPLVELRWYESWSECSNCGWNDLIDPEARIHLDGSVSKEWPF